LHGQYIINVVYFKMKQQHIILGKNRRDAEAQRDRWLSEHPEAKILQVSPVRPEAPTLLMFIGGRDVPRVSIEVEYEVTALEPCLAPPV
jgi:hypothetical protein